MVLQKLKADAEAYLGEKVTEAVITVPAYFTDSQRQATKDAGKIAGLEVKRIINEPTAAALAYGLDKETDQKIMVYDLGGGTFDVSVPRNRRRRHRGPCDRRQQPASAATTSTSASPSTSLTSSSATRASTFPPTASPCSVCGEAAEKAKCDLSGVTSTNINLPYITADANGPKHLDVTLTRAKFNELTNHLVEKTTGPVRQALSDAGLKASDLSKVLLVGGSTRIPAVQDAVKKLTGHEGFKGINPDECVAIGAAIQGGVLGGDVEGILLLDVTPAVPRH